MRPSSTIAPLIASGSLGLLGASPHWFAPRVDAAAAFVCVVAASPPSAAVPGHGTPGTVPYWMIAASDLLIGFSYVGIAAALGVLIWVLRPWLTARWVLAILALFGLFIGACGATHFTEVGALGGLAVEVLAGVRLLTAVASVFTAVLLPSLVPKALTLVRSAHETGEYKAALEQAHDDLARRAGRVADHYRLITEAVTDLVFVTTVDGEILFVSPSVERVLLRSGEKLIGTSLAKLLHPEERDAVRALWRTTVEAGEGRGRVRLFRANDSWQALDARTRRLEDAGEARLVFIGRPLVEE